MVMNFDLQLFCENLKATKPPYECPVDGCGKIYKSYAGIQSHLCNYDHDNPDGGLSPVSVPPNSPSRHASARHVGQTAEADGSSWVEVDLTGGTYKINIHEPLLLTCDESNERPEKQSAEKNLGLSKESCGLQKTDCGVALSQGVKLPEAHFRVLDDYVQPNDVPPKPSSYYRFIEKTQEEIDDEVEYDLDEEDFVWLELMNEKRKRESQPPVSKAVLELLLDRFEKRCYFEVKTSRRLPRDEDAICSVCLDGECHVNNVILFCDLCNLAVHQECYGVPHIPEGSWICRRCLLSPSKTVECCLCPNRRGAFKQTEDGRWAHVVCALWIPEVGFANGVFLEPIDGIKRIAAARWKLVCYICKQRGVGACIQCHKTNCYTAFHVTCAQHAGLYMKTEPIRDTGINGTTLSVRKTAFCDSHSLLQNESASVSSSEEDVQSSCSSLLPNEAKAKARLKLRKARKALAESRNVSPVLAVPVISPESIKEITDRVNFRSKEEFIRRLCSYWSLKRQSKNGVPLLHTSMSSIHILRNRGSHQALHGSPGSTGSPGNKPKALSPESSDMTFEEQFKFCKKLRQQLEKVRLLNELVRKREKLKQEQVKLYQQVLTLQLAPFNSLLSRILDQLQEKVDESGSLTSSSNANDSNSHDKLLDLTELRNKLSHHAYSTVDDMEMEFDRLLTDHTNRCAGDDTQNEKVYARIRDQAVSIFRAAKKIAVKVGFDPKTGLHVLGNSDQVIGFAAAAINGSLVADEEPSTKDVTTGSVGPEKNLAADKISESKTEPIASEPLLISRPMGINRRSAVLHSKKAKQSALRLLALTQQSTEEQESRATDTESTNSGAPDSVNAKPPVSQNELSTKPGIVSNGMFGETSVRLSRSEILGRNKIEVADSSMDVKDVKTTVRNRELTPLADDASDVAENRKSEGPVRRRGRKRLRSESETVSLSEGNVTECKDEETPEEEESGENQRQYATRGKKLPRQRSAENEDIVIPLEPLDLVWAKCTGFPWYPALVIDPKMSKSTAFHNSVPLPVPPPEVLNLRKKHGQSVFLVSFFDARRSWQWLPRDKLDPLGVDSGLDGAKLAENKKPSMKQAVRTAYQKAINHRCLVTGEPLPARDGLA